MISQPIAILNCGLVASVGLSTAAVCAAIRAGVTNPTESRYVDANGEWVTVHEVPLPLPIGGRARLVEMLRLAVEECLVEHAVSDSRAIPLLLCVAERERVGRVEGLDDHLHAELERALRMEFHPRDSKVVPAGRLSVLVALAEARRLLYERGVRQVIIAAADTLLTAPTLAAMAAGDRLLSASNSNGFIPGEAAGALLVAREEVGGPHLVCAGVGLAEEHATIESEHPLRADGLMRAVDAALADAGCEMHDVGFRITDNSGEHYYFKEAALALSRTLRRRKEEFDIWHPADCVGETGAAIGTLAVGVALVSCRLGYAPGDTIVVHAGNDSGGRGAAVIRWKAA